MKNKSCFKNKYIQNIHSKIASPKVPPCHCSMMLNIAPGFFMCWEGRKWTKNISNLFPAQTRVSSVDIYCRCASYVWIQAPVLHSFQPYTDRQSQSQNSSFQFPTAAMSFTLAQMISLSPIPKHQRASYSAELSLWHHSLGTEHFPKSYMNFRGHSVSVCTCHQFPFQRQHKPLLCHCKELDSFLLCRASI